MNTYKIINSDCIEGMSALSDESVHCVVTSPPYYGLRDYGVDGQIGLEASVDAYVAKMVDVFREVRRILRNDGTLWLNLGDSYAANGTRQTGRNDGERGHKIGGTNGFYGGAGYGNAGGKRKFEIKNTLKPKNLIGIPWRVAFALQADGWILRQDIIWHKPNPMPESVKDRCTKAHEYVFLLAKTERYYYDADAVKETSKGAWNSAKSFSANGVRAKSNGANGHQLDGTQTHKDEYKEGRNRRSVWTVATRPNKEAHFATYPVQLIEPCILAGCPENGVVFDPFTGSGTTAIAALQHGKNFIGTELNPEYAKLAEKRIERWIKQNLTQ